MLKYHVNLFWTAFFVSKIAIDPSLTKQIGHDIIAYHHGDGQQEPEWCFKDVLHDEIRLGAEHEHGEVGPGKLWRRGRERGQ